MTTQIIIGVLLTLLGFVLGFFTNLHTMRKVFLSKSDFIDYTMRQEKELAERKLMRERDRTEWKQDAQTATDELTSTIDAICLARRASCASISSTISKLESSIERLFELLRDAHGRLEGIIARMELLTPRNNHNNK